MVFSIHLDNKFILQTDKICNICAYYMLPTEVNAQFVSFQFCP